jgi:protein-tyrosine phosphatase
MTTRILFCCMGNICRSPSAEGVVRALLKQRAPQLSVHLDSAGTHDYHVGEPPDRRTIAAARRREIDLSGLRARTVTASDFTDFDLILAMDESNARELRARAASFPKADSKIRLMMDYVPDSPQREVPDPYYGGPEGFEEVLDLLEAAAAGLLKELQRASI